jgi:hypothetical protein
MLRFLEDKILRPPEALAGEPERGHFPSFPLLPPRFFHPPASSDEKPQDLGSKPLVLAAFPRFLPLSAFSRHFLVREQREPNEAGARGNTCG